MFLFHREDYEKKKEFFWETNNEKKLKYDSLAFWKEKISCINLYFWHFKLN